MLVVKCKCHMWLGCGPRCLLLVSIIVLLTVLGLCGVRKIQMICWVSLLITLSLSLSVLIVVLGRKYRLTYISLDKCQHELDRLNKKLRNLTYTVYIMLCPCLDKGGWLMECRRKTIDREIMSWFWRPGFFFCFFLHVLDCQNVIIQEPIWGFHWKGRKRGGDAHSFLLTVNVVSAKRRNKLHPPLFVNRVYLIRAYWFKSVIILKLVHNCEV